MIEKYALVTAMKEVLTYPIKKFSVHELARATKLSVNASKYSLDYMLAKALVKRDKVGKTYQYQADLENYLARQWKVLFSLEEIDKARIVENILKTKKTILSIILYGSTAIGRDVETSDIDILVIADTDWNGKKSILACAIDTSREPNITVYSSQEWRKKAEVDKIFYEHVIIDSIVLYGQKPVVL